MKILWITWKDKKNPLSGGAEIMNEELAKRAVADGHEIIFLVSGYPGGKKKEVIDGYTVIRTGSRYTVYITTAIYYLKHLRTWPDLIIEEINTMPFFTKLYTMGGKRKLLIYQLAREIWFHELSKKMFPISLLGYLLEPLYLRFLSGDDCLTESKSTLNDLALHGFKKKKINIIPAGSNIKPIPQIDNAAKYKKFTLLSVGSIRSMKQTLHQVKAFEKVKSSIPECTMIIAGSISTPYGQEVMSYIEKSPFKNDIIYKGSVTQAEKQELMRKSHLILVSSIKEGWGLIITEANSQGTPAVAYNVDGLRDAVMDMKTGLLTKENTPEALAEHVISLFNNKELYLQLQKNAYDWSRTLTFDNSYDVFKKVISR